MIDISSAPPTRARPVPFPSHGQVAPSLSATAGVHACSPGNTARVTNPDRPPAPALATVASLPPMHACSRSHEHRSAFQILWEKLKGRLACNLSSLVGAGKEGSSASATCSQQQVNRVRVVCANGFSNVLAMQQCREKHIVFNRRYPATGHYSNECYLHVVCEASLSTLPVWVGCSLRAGQLAVELRPVLGVCMTGACLPHRRMVMV